MARVPFTGDHSREWLLPRVNKKAIGDWGEEIASAFFKKGGYAILEKKYRTPVGEIDLICKRGDVIVFVEVKTRASSRFGGPGDAITPYKKERIIRAARWYIMEKLHKDMEFRFDCLFIRGNPKQYELEHVEAAFEAS